MLDREMLAPHGVARWAAETPDAVALQRVDGETVTYAALHRDALVWAQALTGIGVGAGTHVATLLPDGIAAYRSMLAVAWLRGVEIPLPTSPPGRMLEHMLDHADAEVLLTSSAFFDQVEQVASRLPALRTVVLVDGRATVAGTHSLQVITRDELLVGAEPADGLDGPDVWDVACLQFGTGTAGTTRAVVYPWGLVVQTGSWVPDGVAAPGEGIYCPIGPFHESARSAFNQVATHGARLVLREKFSVASCWDDVRATSCSTLWLVGPWVPMLSAAPARVDDAANPARTVVCCAVPPGPSDADPQRFEGRFGVRLSTCYAQTEIGVPVTTGAAAHPAGTCGRARETWPRPEVRVVDAHDHPVPNGQPGEMVVRCAAPWSLGLGYYNMPAETVEAWRNGWFHTGTSFERDDQGWFYLVDPRDDVTAKTWDRDPHR